MGVTIEDIGKAARHGVTTSVGLGLLVLQHAQVQRRDLIGRTGRLLQTLGVALENRVKMMEERLADLDERQAASASRNGDHEHQS